MPIAIIAATVLSPWLGVVMIIIYLARNFRAQHWRLLGSNTLTKGLFLLALWSSVTALFQGNWISLAASLAIWLYLFIVLYVQGASWDMMQLQRYGFWVFIFGLVSALIGLLQYFNLLGHSADWLHIIFGIGGFVNDPESRLTATFANANLAGAWFGLLSLTALYYFQHTEHKSYRNFYLVVTVVFFIMLALTGSRGAFMGTMVGLFVYSYFNFKQLRIGMTVLFSIGLLSAMIHPQMIPRINFWDLSLMERMRIWKISWKLFQQNPIDGIGLAHMYFVDPLITKYYKLAHAHNTIFSFFVELGLVGGILFIWMHASLAVMIYRLNQLDHPLAPIYMALFSVFVVHSTIDHVIMTPQVGMLYILLCGCVARTWYEVAVEREKFQLRKSDPSWVRKQTQQP
jgi:O-antigen ligase